MTPKIQVTFLPEALVAEAPAGTRLQAIAEAVGADLTFGCGTGACGTCRVHLEGRPGCCNPPGPEERDFLRDLQAAPDERLACQVRAFDDLQVRTS